MTLLKLNANYVAVIEKPFGAALKGMAVTLFIQQLLTKPELELIERRLAARKEIEEAGREWEDR